MPTLAEIRLRACKLWPYGSHAILSLVPVSRPGLGTMAVDQHWRLYFDPQVVADKPLDESAGVVLHEISHLLLKHHRRAERLVSAGAPTADWQRWNVAADYAVNAMLADQNIRLWDGMLCPVYDGFPPLLSAEDYFRRLTDQQSQEDQDDASAAPDGDGDQSEPAGDDAGDAMDVETNPQEAIETLHRQAKAIRECVIPAMEDTLQRLTEQIQAIQAEMETMVAITKTLMDKS